MPPAAEVRKDLEDFLVEVRQTGCGDMEVLVLEWPGCEPTEVATQLWGFAPEWVTTRRDELLAPEASSWGQSCANMHDYQFLDYAGAANVQNQEQQHCRCLFLPI